MAGPSKPLTDEEVLDKLNRTMATAGWKEVIVPGLEKIRDERYFEVLNTPAPLGDFARGALHTIEWFLGRQKFAVALAARIKADEDAKAELLAEPAKEPYTY